MVASRRERSSASLGSEASVTGAEDGTPPVAKRSTVSLVEVSESTVIRLKLRSTAPARRAWSTGAGRSASVNANPSIVAMSGAIIPLPLVIPATRTVSPSSRASPARPLGEGVGGADGVRRRPPAFRGRRAESARRLAHRGPHRLCAEWLADDPGGREVHVFGRRVERFGDGPRRLDHRRLARRPGERVGVARVAEDGPGRAARDVLPAPVHRGGRATRPGEHPRDPGPRRERGQHHVGATPIAKLRRVRGEQNPGNGRKIGKARGGERRYRGRIAHEGLLVGSRVGGRPTGRSWQNSALAPTGSSLLPGANSRWPNGRDGLPGAPVSSPRGTGRPGSARGRSRASCAVGDLLA